MRQRLLLIQTHVWGLLVADPAALYDRDYGRRLESLRAKVRAIEERATPDVSPLFEERPQATPLETR